MSDFYECIVIGAGLLGTACARSLAIRGRGVLLLDRQEPGQEASLAAAGMLAPQIEAEPGDPMLSLALEARDRYPALAAHLKSRTGTDIGLKTAGIALVAMSEDREAELVAAAARQRSIGLDADWLDLAALRKRHPGIGADARGALLAPRDGAVDNVRLVLALLQEAQGRGVVLGRDDVNEVIVEGGRVKGVRAAGRTHEAPVVIVAAGAWAGRLSGLPRPLPVEPVRGQMALVSWPGGESRGVLFGRMAYVVPRGDDALLGSTMERAGFDKATTAEGIRHIRTETGSLLPALLTQAIRHTWSGLRPMTPDHRPIIGRDPDVQGLFYATGHGRNGILLGPITGEIIADLVVRGETAWPLEPYAVDRFSR